jgi:hypothetical protein
VRQERVKARKPSDLRAFQERGRRGSNPQPLDRQSPTDGLQVSIAQQDATDNSAACTTACTSEADLEQVAADLRSRLTVDECRRLAELLTGSRRE